MGVQPFLGADAAAILAAERAVDAENGVGLFLAKLLQRTDGIGLELVLGRLPQGTDLIVQKRAVAEAKIMKRDQLVESGNAERHPHGDADGPDGQELDGPLQLHRPARAWPARAAAGVPSADGRRTTAAASAWMDRPRTAPPAGPKVPAPASGSSRMQHRRRRDRRHPADELRDWPGGGLADRPARMRRRGLRGGGGHGPSPVLIHCARQDVLWATVI